MMRKLTRLILLILPVALPLGLWIGLTTTAYASPMGFAALPTNWVDMTICNPPGGVYDVDFTLGDAPFNDPPTVAGIQAAVNRWDGTTYYRLKIPPANYHGAVSNSAPDGAQVLLYMPIRTGVSKCLVLESATPPTPGVQVCSHGFVGYGGQRDLGCANSGDLAKLWTLTADSTPTSGNAVLYFPPGSNHIVVRHIEVSLKPGAFQSAAGVKVVVQINMLCDHCGVEYPYVHGWNPGDSNQPVTPGGKNTANGGWCQTWDINSTVNTTNSDATHGTVTWVSNIVSGTETSKRFGMPFSDGVHSGVAPYPHWNQATVNIGAIPGVTPGVNYTISNHDPAVTDQTFTIDGQPGTQTAVALFLSNPLPGWDKGCGDDSRAVAVNCDYCWFAFYLIDKIHWWANESHTISLGFSNGPYKIVAGWAECGSACYFSGGGSVDTRGGPANDSEVRRFTFFRDPDWRYLSATGGKSPHPPFGCGPLAGVNPKGNPNDNCPFNWAIKNNIEAKLGIRLLFQAGMVINDWADGQSGYPYLQTVRTISGGSTAGIFDATSGEPRTAINNVRTQDVWIQNVPQVFQLSTRSGRPGDGGGISQPVGNMDYINMVISNVGDDNQWGAPGPDLYQWSDGGSNTYFCNMSRTSGVAHAVCRPIPIANYATNTFPNLDSAFDVSSVTRGTVAGIAHTVTVKLAGLRHDPTVGGKVVISNVAGWNGTFTITGTQNNGSSALCASALGVTPPVPTNCVRPDGTYGDAFTYVDAQGADGTLCTTTATCQNAAGINVRAVIDTLSYRITDIKPGDNVYTHDCSDSSFNVGATSATLAGSGTLAAGLDVFYQQTGLPDVAAALCASCQLENNSGWPISTTLQYVTVVSTGHMSIGSSGKYKQHNNNKFYHNVFVYGSGSNVGFTCTGVTGEGNAPLQQCWQQSNLEAYDMVLPGRSPSNWNLTFGTGPANATPANVACNLTPGPACMGWTGFMTTGSFPTTNCAYNGNPYDCPLMALPSKDNFRLSMLIPVPGSSYPTQGANILDLEAAFLPTNNIYICPIGANCGTHGPYPDFGGAGPVTGQSHLLKGGVTQKGNMNPK